MSERERCSDRREAIAALVLSELDPQAADELRRHIGGCEVCRQFHEALLVEEEMVQATFDEIARGVKAIEDELVERLAGRQFSPMLRLVDIPRRLIGGFRKMRPAQKALVVGAAAALAFLVVFGVLSFPGVGEAYALEQTVEALKSVRYMHLVRPATDKMPADERWIEVGPEGFQVRYRQDTPPNFFVVEDGKTVCVYYKDKNTVVLWDPKDQQWQWIGNLGQFFRDLAGESSVTIEENVRYKGRRAHRVRWLKLNQEYYIDPESKLPIAGSGYDISYEEPPAGTFDIVIPEGVTVVDKRPGAPPAQEPEWMKEEGVADWQFAQARYALAAAEYQKAVDLFKSVVEVQPRRNWAWFWLGRAYYEMGDYDAAIDAYSRYMLGEYAYLARGWAYWRKGEKEKAKEDVNRALGTMIFALRHLDSAGMFDYAEDPRRRRSKTTKAQSFAKMINRLRMVTGQNFDYSPRAPAEEKERVIAAWEGWYKTSGEVRFTPDAGLVEVPTLPEPDQVEKDFLQKVMQMILTGSGEGASGLLAEAENKGFSDPAIWMGLAVGMFHAEEYEQALRLFARAAEAAEGREHASGLKCAFLVWQGHMLDLLSRREEAVRCYREALGLYPGRPMRDDLHGIHIDRQWIEDRLEKPFRSDHVTIRKP